MNLEKLKRAWYPLLPGRNLKNRPVACELFGQKLVLARLNGQAVCFNDCCPHRHVPLSQGKIIGNTLQCCYHGWQFDAQGNARHITGSLCPGIRTPSVPTYSCCEHEHWIWVSLNPDQAFTPYPDFATPGHCNSINAHKTLTGDFIHAIENLLDPTHTPYIHAGLLRSTRTPQHMSIRQSHTDHSFTTDYTLHQQQNGIINRLFGQGINQNQAHFTYPGLARLDYLSPRRLEYRISVFFIPQSQGKVGMSIRAHIPRGKLPTALKALLFRPFSEILLRQDARILRTQYRHHQHYKNTPYQSTPNDLVIDHLMYILSDAAEGTDKSGEMIL